MALRMATRIMTRKRNSEFGDKLDSLRSTIRSLLHEVAADSGPVSIDPEKGIDFYANVERFEKQLIESALDAAGGRQNRAAKLLNLRTSTLCTKMKTLNIRRT